MVSLFSTHFAAAFDTTRVRDAVPPTAVARTEGEEEDSGGYTPLIFSNWTRFSIQIPLDFGTIHGVATMYKRCKNMDVAPGIGMMAMHTTLSSVGA